MDSIKHLQANRRLTSRIKPVSSRNICLCRIASGGCPVLAAGFKPAGERLGRTNGNARHGNEAILGDAVSKTVFASRFTSGLRGFARDH
jgi:hypothetical protein